MSALDRLADCLQTIEIKPYKQLTTLQEASDSPMDKSNKGSNNEEHYRALEPEQKVSYEERSDRQEVTSQAKPHP